MTDTNPFIARPTTPSSRVAVAAAPLPSMGLRVAALGLHGLLAATLLASAVWAQAGPDVFRKVPAEKIGNAQVAAATDGPTVVRSRYVEVDVVSLVEIAEAPAPAEAPSRSRSAAQRPALSFNLFTGLTLEIEHTRSEYSDDGETIYWFGNSLQGPATQVVLAITDGIVSGSISTPSGEFYQIRPWEGSIHVIQQVDYQGSPTVDDAIPVKPPAGKAHIAELRLGQVEQAATSTLDVMVAYTAKARQAAGGATGILNRIQLAVAEANQGYLNSGIPIQLRLVHSYETNYNEAVDISTSLTRFRTAGDGYMDEVHARRDQYSADLVSLWIYGPGASGGVVGIGYLMTSPGSWFAPYAFNVVELNFATGPAYTFAHELGHNQGASHDRNNASTGAYPYSFGFQRAASPTPFRTIMAYQCSTMNCPKINHWSNPEVSYQGYAAGVPITEPDGADNRSTLSNTRTIVEQFRTAQVAAPVAVSVTPSSGSGTTKTFSYTFSDNNGASDIAFTQMLVHSSMQASSGCYLHYDVVAKQLFLADDSGQNWRGLSLGRRGTVENSQCRFDAAKSTATLSGKVLKVNVDLTFKPAFAGAKKLYLYAQDSTTSESGWQTKGSWTIPAPKPAPVKKK